MAKQLNLLGGQVIPTALHTEMERSYLEYAMSVIVGRALPDIRDGLKPVHRRILYSMHELGLTPERPFRKCARVVGDVLGKYHPHGDQAVYDALVRMVQSFSSRYPLLSGHGNFGSLDNDPPAAMRYTETRLAEIADQAMLSEISEATVDFTSNFDNSQQEPVVLPTQLPILLLNGCAGIAVGMATNVPPHNLGEVVDGLIALIDKPELSDEKLEELIPGPDFPTGGEIVSRSGIRNAYRTGRGTIPVRGVIQVERIRQERRRGREKTALVITELPYQTNKAGWIEKVADLVNQGRLDGIADLRDESDRSGMRVVVELKRDASPKKVLRQLYKQTPLQSNFGAIMLALVNNKPCQLSLRELLVEFLQFREQTLRRQYTSELERSRKEVHKLEGLLVALNHLDAVIEILRSAPDGSTAKVTMQEQLNITDPQADSILSMPMRRLTGLERQKLQTEYEERQQRITELQGLLENRHELLKALKKELRSLRRKFGDERRTRIISPEELTTPTAASAQSNTPPTPTLVLPITSAPEDAVLEITKQGFIRWQAFQSPPQFPKSGEDFVVYREPIAKREALVVIADNGKAYPLRIDEVPPIEDQKPLLSLLPKSAQRDARQAVSYFFGPDDTNRDLVLLTQQGRIKRLSLAELNQLSNRGLVLVKLKEPDCLRTVCITQAGQEVAIATTGGRILRFTIDEQQLPIMGRSARGNQALRLRTGEAVAGCACLNADENLLLVTALGYAKKLPVSALRLANRGDIGTGAIQFTSKADQLAQMTLFMAAAPIVLSTNTPRNLSFKPSAVSFWGKDGVGEPVVTLKPDEQIVSVSYLGQ
ncbi:MAG: DNA topoisomerase (ATP-hydrolyzing) subunit A [Cyanophyceae cyanobacterium]